MFRVSTKMQRRKLKNTFFWSLIIAEMDRFQRFMDKFVSVEITDQKMTGNLHSWTVGHQDT